MANVQYRFLPWTRRGLSAELKDPDAGGPLPARGRFSVGLTISNLTIDPSVDLALYGPGDVLGIDPRLIVRCFPPTGAANFEPNFFAAIEFDPPDFPWMFTPAHASDAQQLRPWLVLVVVDKQFVRPPKVAGLQPLPTIAIPAEVAAQELPDLAESWAWAHTQVVTRAGDPTALADALQADPNANISRLICPRHLQANRQYMACLVPAFDAGVTRGLGGSPDPKQPIAPAWNVQNPGKVVLPVYYHWEFSTGPLGDFESLARKLKPFKCPDTVGKAPMYIGDGGPELPLIAPDLPDSQTMMDGALRRISGNTAKLEEIAQQLRDGLAAVLNAPAEQLASGPTDATPVLGPPLYGAWHAKQFTINPANPAWLSELNLDPRTRVAAGLGSEVERKYQEEFMQKCWEQVGEVLKANQRLNWGRLGLEANRRAFERHLRPLPADRLLQITSSVQRRVLLGQATVHTAVRLSSAPDALVDPAMRRSLAPQRPMLQKTVRRLATQGRLSAEFSQTMRSGLVTQLSAGRLADQPTRFAPDGLLNSRLLDDIQSGVLQEVAGIQVDAGAAAGLRGRILQANVAGIFDAPLSLQVNSQIGATGVLTEAHIDSLLSLEVTAAGGPAAQTNVYQLGQALLEVSRANSTAQGILVTQAIGETAQFNPIFLGAGGALQVKDSAGAVRVIGQLEQGTPIDSASIGQLLRELPVNTLKLSNANPVRIKRTGLRDIAIDGMVLEQPGHFHLPQPGPVLHNDLEHNLNLPHLGGVHDLIEHPLIPPANLPLGPHLPPDPIDPHLPQFPHFPGGPAGPHFPPQPPPPPPAPPQPAPPTTTWTIGLPFKDAAPVQQFKAAVGLAVQQHAAQLVRDVGQKVTLNLAAAGGAVLGRLNPLSSVPPRLAELVQIEGSTLAARVGLETGLRAMPQLDRVMAYPNLPAPTYQYLAGYDKERFCPGIGVIPPNSITLLETNPRFIESFLVGLNHEMNRELLWRSYPTDQRGTPFRFFWDWVDGKPDLPRPIHQFNSGVTVGNNLRGAGLGGQIVLLVRGELVRRYPHAVMLAWKAALKNGELVLKEPFAPAEFKEPVFQGQLEPDIIYAGFDLTDADLTGDGWFFLIQEQPTEPRFGFDQAADDSPPGNIARWRDASWASVGVKEGQYLVLSQSRLFNEGHSGLKFGKDAAHMASISLQQPMRVAIHSRYIQS